MEQSWFSDDADPDLATGLGRAQFLTRMWEVVRETHSVRSSTVFGLVGPWGSGKTSMLRWLEKQAATDDRQPAWAFVTFNPWDFQDAASLQLGFFAELSNAFRGRKKSEDLRRNVAAFGRAVAPLASLGAFIGADLSKAIEGAASLIEGDQSVATAREKVEKALSDAKTPVLVVIDDLDRVSAEELLLTLKLVRQLGRLPHVHYLLSYDETTILDVLTRTTLVGEQTPARARDYMEKVVQVRFDIPRLRPSDALRLTNEALRDVSNATGFELTEADASRYSTAYFGFLARRLDTPRALKRYFAQVRLLSPAMRGEVDYVDFLVLTWLRTAEPGVYSILQKRRGELVGNFSTSIYGQNREQEMREQSEHWQRLLLEAGTREVDLEGVAEAIAFLFPRFGSIWRASIGSVERVAELRVANESYFDRYFSFGLTDEDIADATVRGAVAAWAGGEPLRSAAVLRVELAVEANPDLVVEKLARDIEKHKPTSPGVYGWLASLYSGLPDSNDVVTPRRQLENLVAVRLREMTAAEVTAVMRAIIDYDASHLLIAALNRAVRKYSAEQTKPLTLSAAQLRLVREVMRGLLEGAEPTAMPAGLRTTVWSWSRIDPDGFAEWVARLRESLEDIDVLSFFVGSSSSVGTKGARTWLRGLETSEAAKHFDLDELRVRYQSEIEAAPELEADDFDGPPDTPENRRQLALLALRPSSAEHGSYEHGS